MIRELLILAAEARGHAEWLEGLRDECHQTADELIDDGHGESRACAEIRARERAWAQALEHFEESCGVLLTVASDWQEASP